MLHSCCFTGRFSSRCCRTSHCISSWELSISTVGHWYSCGCWSCCIFPVVGRVDADRWAHKTPSFGGGVTYLAKCTHAAACDTDTNNISPFYFQPNVCAKKNAHVTYAYAYGNFVAGGIPILHAVLGIAFSACLHFLRPSLLSMASLLVLDNRQGWCLCFLKAIFECT